MEQSRTTHQGPSWRISLRIWHPDAEPALFDDAVGMKSSHAWRAGDARQTQTGAPLSGKHAKSYATYPLAEGEGSLAAGLLDVLDRIEPRSQRLLALDAELELFVGWMFHHVGNSGDVFLPTLLERMARMRLALSLDLYG